MQYLFEHPYDFFDGRAEWVWSREGVTRPAPDPRPIQCRYFARRLRWTPGQRAVLALSADTRAMLYVNGRIVARGPQKGDVAHQFYDVLDLTDELSEGENTLLVRVDSAAKSFPYFPDTGPSASEMTAATIFVADGFVLNADGSVDQNLATGGAWQVRIDPALEFVHPAEMGSYVGYKEQIDLRRLPRDFYAHPDLSDGSWEPATVIHAAFTPHNDQDAYLPHRLYPRFIEPLHHTESGFAALREIRAGTAVPYLDAQGTLTLTVPAHSHSQCILDAGQLLTAYPLLGMQGGHGARLRLKYAECLTQEGRKDDRNAVEGHELIGYYDDIVAGNGHAFWSPLHWRTFRFIELTVETADEPLTIPALRCLDCHYPLLPAQPFRASDAQLTRFWEIGVRTQQACAHETYEDCPYYEQLQYGGDTQAQMLFTYAMSGNTRLPLQGIRFFDWSRVASGLTQSRYPCRPTQLIPFWSLHYLFMLGDWYAYTGEVQSIKEEILNADSVIRWFQRLKDASGLVGALPHWCVADWCPEWIQDFKADVPGVKEGPTAFANFMFINALEQLAPLLMLLGKKGRAARYLKEARTLRALAHKTFWNKKEGVYLDSPRHPVYSQLTNAWALLLGLPKNEATTAALAEAIAHKPGICHAAYFGQFYVFEAWKKAGRPDLIIEHFASYRQLVEKNVTTWPEDIVGGRSECHAWSNAATYQLLATVLGFTITEPGCRSMRVRPHLEGLTQVEGGFVTPLGTLTLDYDANRDQPFRLTVPQGVTAHFSYQDMDYVFAAGRHAF